MDFHPALAKIDYPVVVDSRRGVEGRFLSPVMVQATIGDFDNQQNVRVAQSRRCRVRGRFEVPEARSNFADRHGLWGRWS